ncbi:hypothetical protein [Trichocoleus sp. DQ-U1]|uniref:AbiJ-NTD4 domain-containing protein n=1 Tax=Trichocoleus sp. DQ-U1 TaxID=2933926 RepID=UPI0032985F65
MESFSQRQGIKPVINILQSDGMDEPLRNGLWSNLCIYYWDSLKGIKTIDFISFKKHPYGIIPLDHMIYFLHQVWLHYFKLPIDDLPEYWPSVYTILRNHFFNCKWNEVYDFIEFVVRVYPDNKKSEIFTERCNYILQRELSAYRFVNYRIARITSEIEINEIEESLKIVEKFKPVSEHLERALSLLSDKENPDYRNSIKESISAVESICIFIAGRERASSLGKAIQYIEKKSIVEINPRLKDALEKMYAYTNDAGGIRHALLEESSLDFEDAKFMLVSCSAFINYLKVKLSKVKADS